MTDRCRVQRPGSLAAASSSALPGKAPDHKTQGNARSYATHKTAGCRERRRRLHRRLVVFHGLDEWLLQQKQRRCCSCCPLHLQRNDVANHLLAAVAAVQQTAGRQQQRIATQSS